MPEKAARRRDRMKAQDIRRIEELEFDLKATKEHLQTTIEELETANEELKSANEELQSSNEEFQSTNEELNTSGEELQSVNEELLTMNSEYQSKIDELSKAYHDLNNLITSTRIATLFLNNSHSIRMFIPPMKDIINLIESDIDRPVTAFTLQIEYPELISDIRAVLDILVMKETTIRHQNRRWFLTRITPDRTSGNVIGGVIVTFTDITELKRMQAVQDTLEFSQGIVNRVREPLIVLDENLRIITVNKSFSVFTVIPKEAKGVLIHEIGRGQLNIPELRDLLEQILPESTEFHDFEIDRHFPGIGRKKLLLNITDITRRRSRKKALWEIFAT